MGKVYVLKLKGGYFYIGFTRYLQLRIRQHFNGKGAKFTKLHKPLKVVEVIDGDLIIEHMMTRKYIEKYGVDKVRGGDWVATTPYAVCPSFYLTGVCNVR